MGELMYLTAFSPSSARSSWPEPFGGVECHDRSRACLGTRRVRIGCLGGRFVATSAFEAAANAQGGLAAFGVSRALSVMMWSDGAMAVGRVRPPSDAPPRRVGGEVGSPTVWIRFAGDVVAPVALDQARLRDFAGSVPWRRWRSHHGQAHLSGSFWAATMGGHVVYESRLELARLLLADFDSMVAAMWAQPCWLVATVDGVQRRHVPDFLFASPAGEVSVVNVKPASRLADPGVAEALAWPRALFTGHGWRYEVWSGCDPVLLENVRFLAGYRRPGIVTDELLRRAFRDVRDGEPLGVAERRLCGDAPGWTVRPALLALLWRHQLTTDLDRPLSHASVLRRRV
jgi:hypothetical protein